MLLPRKSSTVPVSIYNQTVTSSWEHIDALHQDDEGLSFSPDRHSIAVAAMRAALFEAIERPIANADNPGALAAYARAEFLAHAIDAIISAPTLSLETEDFAYWHHGLALQLRYAATRSLRTLVKADVIRSQNAYVRASAVGIANELVPISLINRHESISPTPTLILPGSHIEDHEFRTDLKAVTYEPTMTIEPIQVKTSKNAKGRAPEGGYKIYAHDFDNHNNFIAYALVEELDHPLGKTALRYIDDATVLLQQRMRQKAEAIAKPVVVTPLVMQPRKPQQPSVTNKVGLLYPELQHLKDALIFNSLASND